MEQLKEKHSDGVGTWIYYNKKLDYDKEMEYITNWITRHMKVLDRQLFNDPNVINHSSVVANESDDVYTLQGIKVDPKHLGSGIYIKGCKKIFIK